MCVFMEVISRKFIEKLELKDQEVLIVDTEAGIEHFGRGVEKRDFFKSIRSIF